MHSTYWKTTLKVVAIISILLLFSTQTLAFPIERRTSCRTWKETSNGLLRLRGGADIAQSSTAKFALSPTIQSLLAGSAAGAIGVGVAFPLDTIKTKAQTMGGDISHLGLTQQAVRIWRQEGLRGFFAGVKGMMMGQAVIKALAFSMNDFALRRLLVFENQLSNVARLLLAACWAGFITSFVVTPIERIKVMMQASSTAYKNEIDCLMNVLETDGVGGLFGRGLGPTLIREVPSYGIYFWCFGLLVASPLAKLIPAGLGPLVFGATSGMLSWLPVYPIDVVKTTIQNTEGEGASGSSLEVAKSLYLQGGVKSFFEGLDAKMLRAGVNHAVTFWVYQYLKAP